jgi:hypothetical protein
MFVSCTGLVLSGRGLCDWPIPSPEESYRLWCLSEYDQVNMNNLDTCWQQAGRRGNDYETKQLFMAFVMGADWNCGNFNWRYII